jgi:23S rRNA (pseudouridine1915-N3)-methyltransferase
MRHQLFFLGKEKDSFLTAGVKEYHRRLQHYTTVDIVTLKEKGISRNDDIQEKQGQLLLQALNDKDFVVVLDEKGKSYSSPEFAELISSLELRGIKQVAYLIGGPDGHSPGVRKRGDLLLSFSKMTFTHDMVRLFLLEQLYRAYTIKAGEKYHK